MPRFSSQKVKTEQSNHRITTIPFTEKNFDLDKYNQKITCSKKKNRKIHEMTSDIFSKKKHSKRHSKVLESIEIFEANSGFNKLNPTQEQIKPILSHNESPKTVQVKVNP